MAFGSLAAQGHAGSEMIEAARDAQCKAWQSIIEIPKANAGTTVVKSPLKFEVVIGPMRDRSVRVTNVSGKDLKSITIHVWTGLSDSDKEYYVFVPAWKAKESRQLSRALVMKLMDRMVPAMPVKDAFKYSVWCPELSIENVRLNLPPQHPKVDGKAEFFTKYFLCEPAVNRK
jgi:hypothetical protein